LFCEEGASASAAGLLSFFFEKLEMGFVGMMMGRKKKMMDWREMVILVVVFASVLFSVQQVEAHGGAHPDEEAVGLVGDDASSSAVGTEDLRAKGLILVKVYCLIIVFVATFVGGISPYFLRWNHSFLLLGTQFAGGVFLATALIHFLADSASTFQERTSNPYAFAEMLAVAGFLLTMLGDVVIQHVYSHSRSSHVSSTKPDVEEAPVAAAGTLSENLRETQRDRHRQARRAYHLSASIAFVPMREHQTSLMHSLR
jgi:hypothetical protein